jgi:hypothetical protein
MAAGPEQESFDGASAAQLVVVALDGSSQLAVVRREEPPANSGGRNSDPTAVLGLRPFRRIRRHGPHPAEDEARELDPGLTRGGDG